jgi:hypothetical protein
LHFFECGGTAFFQGVFEKTGGFVMVFVVKLWWVAGKLWCFDGPFCVLEKMSLFLKYFCGDSVVVQAAFQGERNQPA